MPNKKEFRENLINEFLNSLNKPEIDYYCPWLDFTSQKNGVTNYKYKGINSFHLNLIAKDNNWKDPRWFTFNQIKKLNNTRNDEDKYSVEGQHGSWVEYFMVYDVVDKKKISISEYNRLLKETPFEQLEEFKNRYHINNQYSLVFNAHQIKNMELQNPEKVNISNIESKEIEKIAESIKVKLSHDGGNQAYYSPIEDGVHLPLKQHFKSQSDYVNTALHELSHATGHSSRLNRDQSGLFGSEQYAIEELVAEMSCSFLGLTFDKNMPTYILDNHKAYIQSWSTIFKNDPSKFFKAADQAQKAADYIDDHYENVKEKDIDFKSLIDNFILDKNTIKNTNDQIKINEHSFGLELILANENIPLMISGSTLHKIFYGKHKDTINPEIVKNLADYIKNNSVLGVEGFGASKGNYGVFLDIKDKNNNPILVGLTLDKNIDRSGLQINEILTVFGKENIQYFLDHAITSSSQIFMNKKSSLWLTANGLQLPNAGEQVLTSYPYNIPSQDSNVKLPSAKAVEKAIDDLGKKPLNLKEYKEKANKYNADHKKSVVSLEGKNKDEEQI